METKTPEHVETRPMEKLLKFLKGLRSENFYGCVTIKYENGKATHVEITSTRKWEYKDLPFS